MDKTILLSLLITTNLVAQENKRTVEKNGVVITWYHQNDRIHFEMCAPTRGWVTVGFNESDGVAGAYLLMGRIVAGRAEVVEHYTRAAGDYRPITALGGQPLVDEINGKESAQKTRIQFSIPTHALTTYRKNLSPGKSYFMILAFSREDDFQHHSMMRTSVKVTL